MKTITHKMRILFSSSMLFIIASLSCMGQQSDMKKSRLSMSNMFMKTDVLDLRRLPAISSDGNSILFVDKNYIDLKGDLPVEVRLRTTNQRGTTMYWYDADIDIPVPMREQAQLELKENKKKLSDILLATKFFSMIPVENYDVEQKSDFVIDAIAFDYQGIPWRSAPFPLEKIARRPYCCGDADSAQPCIQNSHVQYIWLDPNLEYILVEHGEPGYGFGCEIEPSYELITIKKQ